MADLIMGTSLDLAGLPREQGLGEGEGLDHLEAHEPEGPPRRLLRSTRRSREWLLFSLSLALLPMSCRGPALQREVQAKQANLVFILMDGTREDIFHEMLLAGKLPNIGSLYHAKDSAGQAMAVYSAATTIWPSVTGPAYASFVSGLYPQKSKLAGIRQLNRDTRNFRSYAGVDLLGISDDFTKEYPLIYEVLGEEETFSQQGFVTRRGWREDGSLIKPPHEFITSFPGMITKSYGDYATFDWYSAFTFLGYTSPIFDFRLIDAVNQEFGALSWRALERNIQLVLEGAMLHVHNTFDVVLNRSFVPAKLGRLPAFSFISLHLPDNVAHTTGVGDEYLEAIIETDRIIGAMIKSFKERGDFEDLTVIITSDHGTTDVPEREGAYFPLTTQLARDTGVSIHDSPMTRTDSAVTGFLEDPDVVGVSAVSGNSNVQLYLKAPGQTSWNARPQYADLRRYPRSDGPEEQVDLVLALLRYEAVAHVFAADHDRDEYHVFSSSEGIVNHGIIHTRRDESGLLLYRYGVVEGSDPFSYVDDPRLREMVESEEYVSGDDWARATRDSDYPDAFVQVVQLLSCENAGDIIVDAKLGFEPWTEGHKGEHGTLRKEHMRVPLLLYGTRLDATRAGSLLGTGRLPRTVDLYPTILGFFGREIPSEIRWEVPSFLGFGGRHVVKQVKQDIDGKALQIWR